MTSSHWGAFEVVTAGERIVAVKPFAEDPNPTSIPEILPAAVHHRSRVARPSLRRGWLERRDRSGRGSDDFVALPWDEALDIAAAELDRVRKTHGNGAIFGGSYGWASAGRFHHALSQVHRFLNAIGGYEERDFAHRKTDYQVRSTVHETFPGGLARALGGLALVVIGGKLRVGDARRIS